MSTGGKEYRKEAMRAVRIIGVMTTPILALYCLLVASGLAPSEHYINLPVTLTISLLWVVVSIYYALRPAPEQSDQALRLGIYHVFALFMFMFIIGFAQPFLSLYILLIMGANLYFGRTGLMFSIMALIFTAIIDSMLRYPENHDIILTNGLPVFVTAFLSLAVISILGAQETKRKTLVLSQERERLQYERLLTIINNLSDAAFSTNDRGNILLYNAASLDLLDTNDSLKGKNIGELFTLSDSSGNAINLTEILQNTTRSTRRDDIIHTYAEDDSIRLEITFAPIRGTYSTTDKNDRQGGYIVIMRDITKQKSLEEERDEFISVVSHELRTPITIVEGSLSNLELIVDRVPKLDKKSIAGTVKLAHDQVLYLAKMINDLSTLSRAERGVADEPESIDVTDLLHKMHRQYETEAREKKLHLDLDLGTKLGSVHVSRLYLEELLQNFITNAIKYTKTGTVTVTARRAKGKVNFSVKDSGIGISRSDQQKIFQKFYRSEDYRIRETGGTGLGLYVSTKLARKLHTQIDLKSRLNHGSTFSFELPVESSGPSK